MRTRKNASGGATETILLVGGLAVAVYGYTQGWFNSLLTQLGIPLPALNATAPSLTALSAVQLAQLAAQQQAPAATVCPTGWTVNGANCQLSSALNGPLANIPVGQLVSPSQAAAYNLQSVAFAAQAAASAPQAISGSGGVPALGSTVSTPADVSAQLAAHDAYIIPSQSMIPTLGAVAAAGGYSNVTTSDAGTIYLRPDIATAAAAALPSTVPWQLSQIKTIMSNTGLSGHTRYGMGDFRRHMASRTGRVA